MIQLKKIAQNKYEGLYIKNNATENPIAYFEFNIIKNNKFKFWINENCDLIQAEKNILFDDENSDNGVIVFECLRVENNFRNKGIASEMMNYFIKICKEKFSDIDTMFLIASPIEEKALNVFELEKFYSKFGFKTLCDFSLASGRIMKKYNI